MTIQICSLLFLKSFIYYLIDKRQNEQFINEFYHTFHIALKIKNHYNNYEIKYV